MKYEIEVNTAISGYEIIGNGYFEACNIFLKNGKQISLESSGRKDRHTYTIDFDHLHTIALVDKYVERITFKKIDKGFLVIFHKKDIEDKVYLPSYSEWDTYYTDDVDLIVSYDEKKITLTQDNPDKLS